MSLPQSTKDTLTAAQAKVKADYDALAAIKILPNSPELAARTKLAGDIGALGALIGQLVADLPPPTITGASVTPANVAAGDSVTLNATITNADIVLIDGVARTLPWRDLPSAAHTYTITAYGKGGRADASVAVAVHAAALPLPPSLGYLEAVNSTTLTVDAWATRDVIPTLDGADLPTVKCTVARPDVADYLRTTFPNAAAMPNAGIEFTLNAKLDRNSDHVLRLRTVDGVALLPAQMIIPKIVAATPPPPPPPSSVIGNPLGFDELGISADYWSTGLGIKHSVRGGVMQDLPQATLVPTGNPDEYSADVTAIYNALVANGNTGILLSAPRGFIPRRQNTFPPALTADGVSIPCTASQLLDRNPNNSQVVSFNPNDATVNMDASSGLIALGFAVGSRPASLAFLTTKMWNGAASITASVMQTPGLIVIDRTKPVAGTDIATLRARPDVFFADVWSNDSNAERAKFQRINAWPGDYAADGVGVSLRFGPDQQSPMSAVRYVAGTTGVETLYYSFSIKPLDDGLGLTDNCKIAWAADYQLGILNNGVWQPVTGNGGAPGDGRYHLPDPSSADANERAGYWAGGSWRIMITKGIAGGVQAGYRALFDYTYTTEPTESGYGADLQMPLTPIFRTGDTVHAELAFVMNDVTNPDANGNGTAVPNGKVLVSIQGGDFVPLRSNVAFRRNVRIKFMGAGPCLYHGGQGLPSANSLLWYGPHAAASRRIGPIAPPATTSATTSSGGTSVRPAWINAIAVGSWGLTPNSALDAQRFPELDQYTSQPMLYGQQKNITDYSSGTKVGTQIVLAGGGSPRSSWFGNERRAYDLAQDSPQWHLAVAPTDISKIPTTQDTPTNTDGTPVCNHSYNNENYVAQVGAIVRAGAFNMIPNDRGWDPSVYEIKLGQPLPTRPVATLADKAAWEGAPVEVDDSTGMIYRQLAWQINVISPANGYQQGVWWTGARNNMDRSTAKIGKGKFVRIGKHDDGSTIVFDVWNLATAQQLIDRKPLTGPGASALSSDANLYQNGQGVLVFFRGAFYVYMSPGRWFSFDETTGAAVEIALGGQAPQGGEPWGPAHRVMPFDELGGVAVVEKSGVRFARLVA